MVHRKAGHAPDRKNTQHSIAGRHAARGAIGQITRTIRDVAWRDSKPRTSMKGGTNRT